MLIGIVIGVSGLLFGVWILNNLSLGYLFPRSIVERLNHPVSVTGVTSNALQLGDGRSIPLPYIKTIPADLPILNDAIAEGVEVDPNGHVFGLLRIHHWCGNDPVRRHIARVDLSDMLIMAGADTTIVLPDWLIAASHEHRYGKFGWDVGAWLQSRHITRTIAQELDTERDRTSPHGEALPPHRAYGSRTRRVGW